MARKLIPSMIASLPLRGKPYQLYDTLERGLCLRVSPQGAKTFRYRIRPEGAKGRVITLGPYSEAAKPAHVTIKQAREWVERLRAARKGGPDELSRIEAELKAHLLPRPLVASAGKTVGQVVEGFLKMLAVRRKSAKEAKAVIDLDVLPVMGTTRLLDLKKRDCIAVLEKVVARGSKGRVTKTLRLLNQLLDYAENVEDDFVNPAGRLKAENLGAENDTRDRWLGETEIPIFWRALDPDPACSRLRSVPEPRTAVALRLLLLTAVRTGELRRAEWREIKLESATWTIPIEHQKLTKKQERTAKPFVVPLSPTVLALLKGLRAEAPDSRWVLSGIARDGAEGCYTDKAIGRAMRRMWKTHPELKKLPDASPHDLRRTARTWLGKLRVDPHICEGSGSHPERSRCAGVTI